MPLRDHFRPPVSSKHSWDELHGLWPSMLVRDLFSILPAGYKAAPSVHLGGMFEIDIATFESDARFEEAKPEEPISDRDGGGVATEVAISPTLTLEADFTDDDEYEVRIYDVDYDRELVAAIEIVSPSNKDRPSSRESFVAKVNNLLQKDVCVTIVDLVSVRQFNLYGELLEMLGLSDPSLILSPQHLYAVTLRSRKPKIKPYIGRKKKPEKPSFMDVWFYPMTIGQPLPTLPIWLKPNLHILLPLESSYEETCRLLHIA